jgi:signal peptidase II
VGAEVPEPRLRTWRDRSLGLGWFIGLAALVLVLDFASKRWAERHLPLNEARPGFAFLRWRLAHNAGASFGLLGGNNNTLLAVLAVLAVVLLIAYALLGQRQRPALAAGLGLVLGGTAGNLADRLLRSSVTDFVVVPFWPAIFNIADVAVRAGIVLALLALFWPRGRDTGAGPKTG